MKYIFQCFFLIFAVAVLIGCGDIGLNPTDDSGDDNVLNLTVSKISSSDDENSQAVSVRIGLNLPYATNYIVQIFGPTGYELRRYMGNGSAGMVSIIWDGKNANGSPIKNGCYYFEARAGSLFQRRLMIIQE